MKTVKMTHAGWVGLCPVYMTVENEPYLVPTFSWLDPWLLFNTFVLNICTWIYEMTTGRELDGYPILACGKLSEPVVIEWDDDAEQL